MSPVTYKPNSSCEGGMEVHRFGRYVSVKEYNKLKAEVDRLRKAGDKMASCIQFNEEMAKDYNGATLVRQCVKEWNKAKGGKQTK